MIQCICTRAPAPYDHLQLANPQCIAHNLDVQLVAKGWERNGALWTHPRWGGLFTKEQALDTLS